tara:strand:+ start:814 stop:1512 length:699 start_codon:yes stop_codon:yes gene_type:complete
MKNWLILYILFCIACGNKEDKEKNTFHPQIGDILFQDLDSSPLCDAIEIVTPGYKNANLSHIGIVVELGELHCINSNYIPENNIKILEAIPNRVQKTRLDSFLNRSFDQNNNPKVIVGRLKAKYQHTIQDAISFLQNKVGFKYDNAFLMNNNSYYCSELIYEAFEKDSIFQLKKMTFLHPETHDTLKIWKKYYADLGIKIPQNKLGINPGIMSISEKIKIVHVYGIPDGLEE